MDILFIRLRRPEQMEEQGKLGGLKSVGAKRVLLGNLSTNHGCFLVFQATHHQATGHRITNQKNVEIGNVSRA